MKQFQITNLAANANIWRKRRSIRILSTWALIIAGPILLGLTLYMLRATDDLSARDGLRFVISLDLIYALIVTSVITWNIYRVVAARRQRSAGSQLHLRLSGAFALLALIPTVLVAIFAIMTFNFGLENWFSERVRDAVGSSLSAAEAYEQDERDDLETDIMFLAFRLNDLKRQQSFVTESDIRIALTQLQNLVQRGLKEAYVIDGGGGLRARGEFSYLFGFEAPTRADMAAADGGELVVIEDWENNEFRALIRLELYADRYLYVSREVDGEILALLDETRDTLVFYNEAEGLRNRLLLEFGLYYLGFAAVVILSAILLGFLFAERLARPVGRLAGAAQRVGAGDLDVRVIEEKGDDEIALLSRMFNRMTQRVKKQRDDLIDLNSQTEERRRLFDSVLSGVTAGVIGLSPEGKISFINNAAAVLLNIHREKSLGKSMTRIVPEFSHLYHQISKKAQKVGLEEIHLTRAGNAEVLMVRIAELSNENQDKEGYVVTFDDVTDLVSAQRMAAWGDVARRIAHEIKNPLTPIRLSAERMKHKFSPLVGDNKADLEQYSDVIIRQTTNLRRIVDEFSKFARMPSPEKSEIDISKVLEDAVTLQRSASPEIKISLSLPKHQIISEIDENMLSQAFINLLKNASEAVNSQQDELGGKNFQGKISVKMASLGDGVEITISDNGIGLPKEQRSRLFEPYVTHREDGTGLGLPIVKKIIEEHDGVLELSDARRLPGETHKGAKARIYLPQAKMLKEEKKTTSKVA